MTCLAEATVVGLISNRLPQEDVTALETHMDGCSPCRQLVAEVARTHYTQTLPGGQTLITGIVKQEGRGADLIRGHGENAQRAAILDLRKKCWEFHSKHFYACF